MDFTIPHIIAASVAILKSHHDMADIKEVTGKHFIATYVAMKCCEIFK